MMFLSILTPVLIFYLFNCSFYCTLHVFPPTTSHGNALFCMLCVALMAATLFCLFAAMFADPGFVPLKWNPTNVKDVSYLEFCRPCNGFKPLRSHHCRRCNRCVKRMDHHCQFIDNCVGYNNHGYFLSSLIFGLLSIITGLVPISVLLWKSSSSELAAALTNDIGYPLLICAEIFLLVIGSAVATLLSAQLQCVLSNLTYIERLTSRIAKAQRRPFKNPYDVSVWQNVGQLCGFVEAPLNERGEEGVTFSVQQGTNKFAFQIEKRQLCGHGHVHEHETKQLHLHTFRVVNDYSGMVVESAKRPVLQIKKGDKVIVLKQKGDWLWGKTRESEDLGWFPKQALIRPTAIEVKN